MILVFGEAAYVRRTRGGGDYASKGWGQKGWRRISSLPALGEGARSIFISREDVREGSDVRETVQWVGAGDQNVPGRDAG